ncbi:NBAS subunit of NRZ tethering complex-like [Dermacentor albipictus]|uniref:NBAS subunit of NRZ tethering complex-like n=1 Tax=Dermacentor albipictus TaxID=60249 RepID=UPI0031FE3CC9
MAPATVNSVDESGMETENNILYELLTYAEWQQEPEKLSRAVVEKSDDAKGSGFWGWLGLLATSMSSIPPAVQRLRSFHMEWHFVVGGDGKVLAILQDQCVEIRSSRDEYATVIGRGIVSRDPMPQWRRIAWSPDCSFLAVALSTGRVEFFDTVGSTLFHIPEPVMQIEGVLHDISYAMAGILFTEARVHKTQWSYEFITVNYRGELKSYLLSPSDGYRDNHSLSLASFYSKGVTSVQYHPSHQVLFVAGRSPVPQANDSNGNHGSALEFGITAWRFLSDYPHYKLVTTLSDDMLRMNPRRFLKKVSFYYKQSEDTVYQLSISPSGTKMAAAHTSGALSVWAVPSLTRISLWQLEDMPNFDHLNPQAHKLNKRRYFSLHPESAHLTICDMNWWSDDCLILAHHSGAVKVVSLLSRRNLLGDSPEWFEFSPQVSGLFDRGFLAFECEWLFAGVRTPVDAIDGGESSDEETLPPSLASKAGSVVRHALYYVTDSERFAPPRKKPKIITKLYRLLYVKSTTPEELFAAKIDAEEYGEALDLARTYGLDSDLVYQRQWRKSSASVAAIQDYLSKINKCTWVLHECLERVPESLEAARRLLEFGLQGTDVEALVACGQGTDGGRFILSEPPVYNNEYEDKDLTEHQLSEKQKVAKQEWRKEWLAKVDFANLSLDQRWLCECRLKLLVYLDRLAMYEIQEGLSLSPEKFDADFFESFRCQPPLEAALSFAQEGNATAVSTLFTYAGMATLPHWLTVVSNFPETLPPSHYSTCLPKARITEQGTREVISWDTQDLREKDWCEEMIQEAPMVAVWNSFDKDFYDDNPSLQKWWTEEPTCEMLTQWYSERAHEIEEMSFLVENALELVKIGCLNNVEGLGKLYGDLLTLETLVYECRISQPLTLAQLEEISDGEKIRLLMSMSSEKKYVLCFRDWLLPFVNRCERASPGSRRRLLGEFLSETAKEDLLPCVQVFENSNLEDPERILQDAHELAELALSCIRSCQREDQLDYIERIIKCVPQRGASGENENEELKRLHDELDALESCIEVAECFQRYGAKVCVKTIADSASDVKQLEVLLKKVTSAALKRTPPLTENDWSSFLDDILQFQKNVFSSITVPDCVKIVANALLGSGNREFIGSASKLLTCHQEATSSKPRHPNSLPYKTSVDLVLSAAREYVDSAASHSDSCIPLARACLQILDSRLPEVKAELDFLSALPLLSQFKVAALPVQARHCDKMELVREALHQTPNAYKQSSKVLKLAELLHLYGEDTARREGAVLSLLANVAFEDADYKHCYEVCQKLMAGYHSEGWKICQNLGECTEFTDLAARQKLLAFSLCYCPDTAVDHLLKATQMLELQEIYQQLDLPQEELSSSANRESIPDNKVVSSWGSGDSVKSDGSQENSWGFVGFTAGKTRSMLTTLGSADFWKSTVRNLTNVKRQKTVQRTASTLRSNSDLKQFAVPAIYESVFRDAYVSKYNPSYEKSDSPNWSPVLVDLFNVLRASMIAEAIDDKSPSAQCSYESRSSILLGLAKGLLPDDTLLAMCCLFGVQHLDQVEEFFLNLPSTPVVLSVASYFFSLLVLVTLDPADTDRLLSLDAQQVVQEVSSKSHDALTDGAHICATIASRFCQMQADLAQAELLKKQGGSIDVERFTEDNRYKAETILGMALTLDQEALEAAVSLGRRYDIPAWDIYICHLEFLFSEGCDVADIEQRLLTGGMLEALLSSPESLREQLFSRIYPSLNGSDHGVMRFFYKLLDICGRTVTDNLGLKPSDHLMLLERLQSACPQIDYKALLEPGHSPLVVLSPFVNKDTVQAISELAPSIPCHDGSHLTSSSIFCTWASKLFLSKGGETVLTTTEWTKHFDKCRGYLENLSPSDLVTFAESVAFDKVSLERVSRRIRLDVVRQCLKLAKQYQVEKTPKIGSEKEWNDAAKTLQSYLSHLQRVVDGVLDEAVDPSNPVVQSYAIEFELSRGIPTKLEAMLLRCAMSETKPGLLQSLLSCCPPNTVDKQPTDIYSDAILLASEQLRNPEKKLHDVFDVMTPEEVLERILRQVLEESEDMFVGDMVLDLLRPFCLDSSVAIHVRLKVLEILEKNVSLSTDDENLLLLLQVQTLIWSEWPDYELDECTELDCDTRQAMFDELLDRCTTLSGFVVLGKLLQCGDPLDSTSELDPKKNPWTRLIYNMLLVCDKTSGLDAAESLFLAAIKNCNLNLECCRYIFCEFEKKNSVIHIVRAFLQTDYSQLHKDAIAFLRHVDKVSEHDYDDTVLNRILQLRLLPDVVSTALYQPVVDHLIASQGSAEKHFSIEEATRSLTNANMLAEAGTLLLQSSRTHPAVCTFNAAVNAARRFLRGTTSEP